MEETTKTVNKRPLRYVLLTILACMTVILALALMVCYQAISAESYARYMGIKNVSAENLARTIRGVEIHAKNVFKDVAEKLGTPEEVIEALQNKANFNNDVKGYFAAFELNYFPEKGTWFEPYIYQPDGRGFEYKQVGSARHNYTKSPWYIKAKTSNATFWSDPYYYYDGTSLSGHYCTFIKPIYDPDGKLICVCGADMNFEWMAKELGWVDETTRKNRLLNRYHAFTTFSYYTVILDKDGTCVAHPQDKAVTIGDNGMLKNLADKKSGVIDMDVDGEPCTVYYGPIDYVDWSLAIIVPRQEIWQPMITVGAALSLVGVISMIIIWFTLRRWKNKYEKAD